MVAEKQKLRGWKRWLTVFVIAILVMAAAYITLRKEFLSLNAFLRSRRRPEIVKKYADALSIALLFFDVLAGKLGKDRISWRGDSGLEDGKEENLDLSKGLYDAGDNVKFGLPMAFTATVLSWSILEYGERMTEVKDAKDELRWITISSMHIHLPICSMFKERPQTTKARPLIQVNTSFPGSDVAAETAAAMASASLVFGRRMETIQGCF